MKLTIVEKNLLSWTAMHIDFVMCNKRAGLLQSLVFFLFLDRLEVTNVNVQLKKLNPGNASKLFQRVPI